MAKDKETNASEVIGSLEKLVGQLSKQTEEREWITHKITKSGPPHKQWQHTLVLSRLQALINQVGSANGKKFKPLKGKAVVIETPEHAVELPLSFPDVTMKTFNKEDEIPAHISKGPEHEVAYTAILLQGLEWLLAATGPAKEG